MNDDAGVKVTHWAGDKPVVDSPVKPIRLGKFDGDDFLVGDMVYSGEDGHVELLESVRTSPTDVPRWVTVTKNSMREFWWKAERFLRGVAEVVFAVVLAPFRFIRWVMGGN